MTKEMALALLNGGSNFASKFHTVCRPIPPLQLELSSRIFMKLLFLKLERIIGREVREQVG